MRNVIPLFGTPQASVTSTTEPPVAGSAPVPTQSEPAAVRARLQRLTTVLRRAMTRLVNELPAGKLPPEELSQFMNQFGELQGMLVELFEQVTNASGDPNNAAIEQQITADVAPQVQSFAEGVEALGPFKSSRSDLAASGAMAPDTKKLLWFGGLLALGGLAVWWMARGGKD